MINPIAITTTKIHCTFLCTDSSLRSPITGISPVPDNSILVKTHEPFSEVCPVAPNVAGSIPVSHPNLLQFLFGFFPRH
jgi:hypothetical protein